MSDFPLAQARLAHRRGDFKLALELSENASPGTCTELSGGEQYDLLVLRSHCLHALGRWYEALSALDSASQVGGLDAESAARLMMHTGYLMGSFALCSECWSLLNQDLCKQKYFGEEA